MGVVFCIVFFNIKFFILEFIKICFFDLNFDGIGIFFWKGFDNRGIFIFLID